MSAIPSIRVLAIMEASSVTGPAKNLLQFCNWTRSAEARNSGVNLSVAIATFCREPDGDGRSNAFVQAACSQAIDIHIIREQFAFDRRILPQLRNLIDTLRPDLIQTHNVKSGFVYSRLRPRPRVPWIAFQHGYTVPDLKMRIYNQLDRLTLRSADRVVTVCQAFVPQLLAYGVQPDRVRILHNSILPPPPVSQSDQLQLRREFGLGPDDTVILNIGRFSKEKGHADLLKALSLLRRQNPDLEWKLILVGTGPEQPRIARLSAELGLTDRVVMAGFRSAVTPFFAISGLFVLPSHSEGSPNVLLEAMASRLPIVATQAGGTPEIAGDGETALLVEVRNPPAMAHAIRRLMLEKATRRRLADAAYARVVERFSPDCYRSLLVSIYTEALSSAAVQDFRLTPA